MAALAQHLADQIEVALQLRQVLEDIEGGDELLACKGQRGAAGDLGPQAADDALAARAGALAGRSDLEAGASWRAGVAHGEQEIAAAATEIEIGRGGVGMLKHRALQAGVARRHGRLPRAAVVGRGTANARVDAVVVSGLELRAREDEAAARAAADVAPRRELALRQKVVVRFVHAQAVGGRVEQRRAVGMADEAASYRCQCHWPASYNLLRKNKACGRCSTISMIQRQNHGVYSVPLR